MTPDKELRLLAEEVIPFIETRNSEIWKAYRAATPPETILALLDRLEAAEKDAERLQALINTPLTDEYFEAVRIEAAHQQERWGSEHDAGKTPQDWFWLLGYLAGKAVASPEKRLHHIISSAAVLLNWHRNETGVNQSMRPGITPPAALKESK